ncbi:hypothetical protein BIW11_13212 [Tropilaelaps mercedesae]|uniref:Uncharacterized protein n=1 Tax=Tropilaelaps mercedesae TaxID=418985 RepID=A0A1V9X3I2_9ACAR|nr:hypothetical protein BIW11_13212 [Tropilaelaps mercedesae]
MTNQDNHCPTTEVHDEWAQGDTALQRSVSSIGEDFPFGCEELELKFQLPIADKRKALSSSLITECDNLNILNITTWHTCCKGTLVCKRIRLARTTVGLCHPPECLNTIGTVRCPHIWEYNH